MGKRLRVFAAAASVILAFFSVVPTCIDAATDDTIQKEYEFTSESKDHLYYPAEKEITENGDTYVLQGVSYEVIAEPEPVSVVKKVITDDPEEYKHTIHKTIDGEEHTLIAEEPEMASEEMKNLVAGLIEEGKAQNSLTPEVTEKLQMIQRVISK